MTEISLNYEVRFNPRDNGEPFRTYAEAVAIIAEGKVSIPEIMGSPFGRNALTIDGKYINIVSIPEIMGSPFGPFSRRIKPVANFSCFNPRDNGEPFRTLATNKKATANIGFNPRDNGEPFRTWSCAGTITVLDETFQSPR